MALDPHTWEREERLASEDADGYPDTPTLAELQWEEHEAQRHPDTQPTR